MIECLDSLQISINERFDHLSILITDAQQMAQIIKEQERKRIVVKNFRVIKIAEKQRISNQQRILRLLQKYGHLNRSQLMASENMFVNCMNQYLNTDYQTKKTGDERDVIEAFLFYYKQVQAHKKVQQLTVVANCQLFNQTNFLADNLGFFLSNLHASFEYAYQAQKTKFLNMTKSEVRSLSPQQQREQDQQKFDASGRVTFKKKKKLQQYCFELSKLLDLESIYLNYFYFNSLDAQRRKKSLSSNFLKRNVHVSRIMRSYEVQYKAYIEKSKK